MELELTKEQYKHLLRLIYLGNSIALSIKIDQQATLAYTQLEQYIYSKAANFGLADYVYFDKELKQFFPSEQIEWNQQIRQYKQEYDELVFWEELAVRLGRRDFLRVFGKERVEKMEAQERYKQEFSFVAKYRREFERYGIERLEIR